jgi:hypothetical protein
MKITTMSLLIVLIFTGIGFTGNTGKGIRGDSLAVAGAIAMVESMGGMDVWSNLKSLHFVHTWYPWYMPEPYSENEILDLTAPRSWVKKKSNVYDHLHAYSPEYKYWIVEDGKFSYTDEERLNRALSRAPFNIYRLARAIATGDSSYEVRFGEGDIPRSRRLEFYGPDGNLGGWIILNVRGEPIVWATTQYRYTFGPLKRFGDILVPNWAVYETGMFMYEMVSLTGTGDAPDSTLFMPPEKYRK